MSNKDGWATIDLEQVGKEGIEVSLDTEKLDTVKTDTENSQTTEQDSPKPRKNSAEARIKELINQRNSEIEARKRDQEELFNVRKELDDLKKTYVKSQDDTLGLHINRISEQEKTLKAAWKQAFDKGDAEEVERILDQITTLKMERQFAVLNKKQTEHVVKELEKSPTQKQTRQDVEYGSKPRQWAKQNEDWFGKDKAMTAYAIVLDAELKNEGFDPDSDEFYEEVEKRVAKEFPEKWSRLREDDEFQEEEAPKKRSYVVGRPSGSSKPPNKIKLDAGDLRIAKLYGLTPEEFARERLRISRQMEKDPKGYTKIFED